MSDIIQRLKEQRKHYCTGPCGQSSSVLDQRSKAYAVFTDAVAEIERLQNNMWHVNEQSEFRACQIDKLDAELDEYRWLLRELRNCVADWKMSPSHIDCGCAICDELRALAARKVAAEYKNDTLGTI